LRTEADGVALEDEHIIPDGIGGDLILPAASCRACACKINVWEQRVQKRNLGVTRDAAGLKSRKRRGSKAQSRKLYRAVAAEIREGEDIARVMESGPPVTNREHLPPMVISEITLGRAELLGGPIPGNGIRVAFSAVEGGLETVSVDFHARGGEFLRLIAKIAHGMAVAILGLSSFSPYLTDIILGNEHSPDDFWKHIGTQTSSRGEGYLHRSRVVPATAFVRSAIALSSTAIPVAVAQIQLFASYGGPIYEVVVGAKRGLPQRPV
jgi:hypothetical protein